MRVAFALLFVAATLSAAVVDDLNDVTKWTAAPSDGVVLTLVPDSGAMRMDFDFRGHGGWAAARRAVNLDLPANYRFSFRLRGETPANTLEIKFIDPSGENVWWVRRVAWSFPHEWTEVVADKRFRSHNSPPGTIPSPATRSSRLKRCASPSPSSSSPPPFRPPSSMTSTTSRSGLQLRPTASC